jgi:tetratricopeptide (TPR) repeat protein
LENLGKDRAKEALEAYQDAIRKAPTGDDVLWYLKGKAQALQLMGEMESATIVFQEVIEKADQAKIVDKESKKTVAMMMDEVEEEVEAEAVDSGIISLLGWCRYELGDYNEALRLLRDAAKGTEEPESFSIQFDIALVLACSHRFGLALEQYRSTLKRLLKTVSRPRQRGLLLSPWGICTKPWKLNPH